jgi:hypothetical protein
VTWTDHDLWAGDSPPSRRLEGPKSTTGTTGRHPTTIFWVLSEAIFFLPPGFEPWLVPSSVPQLEYHYTTGVLDRAQHRVRMAVQNTVLHDRLHCL